mgnify:CR=1 FL=1
MNGPSRTPRRDPGTGNRATRDNHIKGGTTVRINECQENKHPRNEPHGWLVLGAAVFLIGFTAAGLQEWIPVLFRTKVVRGGTLNQRAEGFATTEKITCRNWAVVQFPEKRNKSERVGRSTVVFDPGKVIVTCKNESAEKGRITRK